MRALFYFLIFIILNGIHSFVRADIPQRTILYTSNSIYNDEFSFNYLFIELDGGIGEGDVSNVAKICPESSRWVCISSPLFDFAAPKEHSRKLNKWMFNGLIFELKENIELSIFGNKVFATQIKVVRDNVPMFFYYSFTKVLLGISVSVRENLDIIRWSTSEFGFGWQGYKVDKKAFMTSIQEKALFDESISQVSRMECLYNSECPYKEK